MKIKNKIEYEYVKDAIKPWGNLFVDTLPYVSDVIDICRGSYKAQKNINFTDFIEGVAYDFYSHELSDKDIKKLQRKLQNEENNQIIGNILDAVFFSKNRSCRLILGIIAGACLRDDTLDYENMTLVIALKDILDDDLQTFTQFYSVSERSADDNTCFYPDYVPMQRLVLEKLQNLNILGKDLAAGRFGGGTLPLRYQKTSVSHRLMEYLNVLSFNY